MSRNQTPRQRGKPSKPKARNGSRRKARKPAKRKSGLAAYAAARLAGLERRQALLQAGYAPTTDASGAAMAAQLERKLRDVGGLEAALLRRGVSHEVVADVIADGLASPKYDDNAAALKLMGQWFGWKHQGVRPDGPLTGTDHAERTRVEADIRAELERRAAAGGAGDAQPRQGA